MATELVLAFTLGQRDIQVLTIGPDDRLYRLSPDKDTVGDFHRAILAEPSAFGSWLPALLSEKLDEPRRGEAVWENGSIRLTAEGHRLAEHVPGEEVQRCWLTFGLLWRALRALESEVRSGACVVREILLFHTDRGTKSDRANSEPVAAAPSLRRWLIDHLSLSEDVVRLISCLNAGEQLTSKDRSGNTHLLLAAAERIESAIRSAKRRFPGATARLCVSGGIPALSEVVQASSQLHFTRVQYRSPTEDPAEADPTALTLPATPAEVLHTRRRVRDLVGRGEFAAAGALAGRFNGQERHFDWSMLTLAVSQYFKGLRGSAAGQAEKRSSSQTAKVLGEVCRVGHPDCLHVALRAEAAIRRNDVFSAASAAVTFLDVSMLDAAEAVLSRNSPKDCVDWTEGAIVLARSKTGRDVFRSAALALIGKPRWIHNFDEEDVNWWLKRGSIRVGPPWQELAVAGVMRSLGAVAVADGFERLVAAVNQPQQDSHPPVKYRNIVTHSLPDEAEINAAIKAFETADLWAKCEPGRTFLHSNGPASMVLRALGVPDPLKLYDDLVAALVHDIEECPLA